MKRTQSLLFSFIVLAFAPGVAHAQAWSGILGPTRAIDWSQAGIPGGIPSVTTICSTIQASTYGNGASDATSGIQAALNSCPANQVVSLSAGTFLINSSLVIPTNVVLRGAGAASTILNLRGSSTGAINFGAEHYPSASTSNTITGGATQGSTSITVSGSGISTGQLLMISQTNTSYMTESGSSGVCSWCNAGVGNDSGQTVLVTSVSGSTITFRPPLYMDMSANSPVAYPYTAGAKNAGLESLQLYGNNTGYSANIFMSGTLYSWVKGVESNFADGNHITMYWSFGNEIRDSYFHDGYSHGSGQTDDDIDIARKSSANLVINNILWRDHGSIMFEWGASGNVVAYNYTAGNYHSTSFTWMINDFVLSHGAHPMFNLIEGNVGDKLELDSTWGSSSHYTLFRNWFSGSRQYVPPADARGALQLGSAAWESANTFAYVIDYLSQYDNLVGNIAGSAHLLSTGAVNSRISPASGGGSPACSRFGYNSDDNSAVSPNNAYNTAFLHGNYDCIAGTFSWNPGTPQTLPASFFLNGKPSWWGTVPWPPIGPDVTGGNIAGVNGHANAIPAQSCFNTVTLNGTINTGTFNAATCYVSGPRPNPPTGLAALVQ